MPNILWVDDEIHMLKGHLLFLEGKGYSFETCNNGIDALEEFGQMVYIVARKDESKDNIILEQFTFTRDNFIDALTM